MKKNVWYASTVATSTLEQMTSEQSDEQISTTGNVKRKLELDGRIHSSSVIEERRDYQYVENIENKDTLPTDNVANRESSSDLDIKGQAVQRDLGTRQSDFKKSVGRGEKDERQSECGTVFVQENLDWIDEFNKPFFSEDVQSESEFERCQANFAMKQLEATAENQSNQNDEFDASSQSSSQNEKSRFRSPRKFQQGLKTTGLLQNATEAYTSGKTLQKNASPSKMSSSHLSPWSSTEGTAHFKKNKVNYRHCRGFYLENFDRMISTVLGQQHDIKLLNDEDLSVIKFFKNLSLSAQKLYVRLFLRKVKWNKVSKIDYQEICDQQDNQSVVQELTDVGFLYQGKMSL